jgi:hypothetical protein
MKKLVLLLLSIYSASILAQNTPTSPQIGSIKQIYCEGDSVVLTSNVRKSPNTRLYWVKDTFWQPDLRDSSIAVIINATSQNSGNYQLVVQNLSDSSMAISGYLEINVHSKPSIVPPAYTIGGGLTSPGLVEMQLGYSSPWTVEWYAPNGTYLGTGNAKSYSVDASMHNQHGALYFTYRLRNDNGCLSHNYGLVGWSVGPNPPPMLYTSTSHSNCFGTTVRFDYIGGCTNGRIEWYTDWNKPPVPAPSVSIRAGFRVSDELSGYWVVCNRNGVVSTPTWLRDLTLSTYEAPSGMAVINEITIRPKESALLEASGCSLTGGENNLHWFDGRYGKELGIGRTYLTPPLTKTKIYYVACASPCGDTYLPIKVNVIPEPVRNLNLTLNGGAGNVTAYFGTPAVGTGHIEIEYSVDGGQSFRNISELSASNQSEIPTTDTSVVINGVLGGQRYCFRVKSIGVSNSSYSGNACIAIPCSSVFQINDNQPIVYFCTGSSVTLTTTNCFGTVTWSNGLSGKQLVASVAGAYSATCTSSGCSTQNATINVVQVAKPTLTITNPVPVDVPATIDLTNPAIISGSLLPPRTVISYLDDSLRVLPSPASLTSSGTYYIRATSTSCPIETKPVIVTISHCYTPLVLTSTSNFSTGSKVKQSNYSIAASNIISGTANITYKSQQTILLTPETNGGFTAYQGTVFNAEIGGCAENGLVAHYPFDGNTNDVSNNNRHAQDNNATLVPDRFNRQNKAYSFNGNDQSMGLGDWFNYNNFTIMMWVNPADIQQNTYADIMDNNHAYNTSWVIQQDANSTNNYYAGISGSTVSEEPFSLAANQWQHLAIVKATERIRIYINGNIVADSPYGGNPDYTLGVYLRLGAHAQRMRFWNGKLDDVKFYDRPLTVNEIQGIFRFNN